MPVLGMVRRLRTRDRIVGSLRAVKIEERDTQSVGERRYRERCIAKLGFPFRGDERLVDVCCGNGGVARLLRPRVGEVVAVDIESSEAWADGSGIRFEVADGEHLPFEDQSFDLIHSKDSLHHMQQPELALREYRRVLKPGGTALIVEANCYNPTLFVHITKLLGHEHFTRQRFRSLVRASFPEARFGAFEVHYVPGADRLLSVQDVVENALERLPPYARLRSYHYAIARRDR